VTGVEGNWLLASALALTLCAAVWDVRTGLIPNRLIVVGAAVTAAVRLASALLLPERRLLEGLLLGAAGLTVCALVPLVLHVCRGIGGGDVKLLALCGLCLGPGLGFELQLYAFSLGSLYAFLRLAYQGFARARNRALRRVLVRGLSASAALLTKPVLPRAFLRGEARGQNELEASAPSSFRFGPAIFVAALVITVSHWTAP
jgi:Flp pilus assembly protein protease CpaA